MAGVGQDWTWNGTAFCPALQGVWKPHYFDQEMMALGMWLNFVFFRPTPYGFRQVVQHVSKHVAYEIN